MRAAMTFVAAGLLVCTAWGCKGEGTINLPSQGEATASNNGDDGTEHTDPFPDLPCEGIACEEPVPSVTPRVTRLTHHQWENAVRDLLYLEGRPGLSDSFLADTLSTSAFDRMAENLTVTPGLWEDYREAAEVLAAQASSDPAALARLEPADAPAAFEERSRAFVESFGQRAYRRPLTDAEIDEHLAQMNEAAALFGGGESFAKAAELALRSFLQSPHFLYRVETHDDPEAQFVPLNSWERASKLSFALWNTMPDDVLFEAAARGELEDADRLRAQVDRMLKDDRARDVVADFHAQLLGFSHFEEMAKASERFPEFSDATRESMRHELELFIEDVVFASDGSYRDLMTDTHSFIDAELAPIYGVEAPAEPFARVELDEVRRPGVLTRAGFLALNATAYDPNPIHRGVFVDRIVLCMALPQPPDNFSIPDGVAGNTNRERIENATGECGGMCHTPLINPPGFAFENYDAVGAWRTMDGSYPVDSSGELFFDGETNGWNEGPALIGLLAASKQAHQCYASHWFEYLSGRPPGPGDAPLVARLGEASLGQDASVKTLLAAIVTNPVFLSRDSGRGQQ